MFPLNKKILPESVFGPSKTTERALPPTLTDQPTRPLSLPGTPQTPPDLPAALTPTDRPEEPLYIFQNDHQLAEAVVFEEIIIGASSRGRE